MGDKEKKRAETPIINLATMPLDRSIHPPLHPGLNQFGETVTILLTITKLTVTAHKKESIIQPTKTKNPNRFSNVFSNSINKSLHGEPIETLRKNMATKSQLLFVQC